MKPYKICVVGIGPKLLQHSSIPSTTSYYTVLVLQVVLVPVVLVPVVVHSPPSSLQFSLSTRKHSTTTTCTSCLLLLPLILVTLQVSLQAKEKKDGFMSRSIIMGMCEEE
jgi:hypothetical protein